MPFDPPFSGYIQPPGVPPDPTGDCWRGPAGPQGPPGPVGTGDASNTPVTATGSTTPRMLNERFADWLNVQDFGAKLDGTTSDTAAVNGALNAAGANGTVWFPYGSGNMVFSWLGVNGGPQTPLLWKIDGTLSSGVRMNRAFQSRNNLGDVFENFYAGTKFLSAMSAKPDQPTILSVEYGSQIAGGSAGAIHTPIRVTATDNAGAVTSTWGVHVALTSNSNQPGWPQNVGVSSTLLKYGAAWCAGMHITASDRQNLPSSTGGTMLGMEIGYHTNAADDTLNGSAFGGVGTRMGLHLSLSEENASGVLPAEISFGILADGDANAIVKSPYAVGNAMRSYQVFDARGATAPAGYSDPVAGLRMLAGMCIDFNGGAALNSNAGNYLQYTTSGTPRLRYMSGAVEQFAISGNGGLSSPSLPLNVLSYGAVMDGTTNNLTAFNAARAAASLNGTIQVPRGKLLFPNGISGGLATPALWRTDGTTFPDGIAPIVTLGMPGDVTEGFFNGNKYFGKRSALKGPGATLRVDMIQSDTTGGSITDICGGISVVTQQNLGNTNSVWGLAVVGDNYADATSGGMVGIQSTVRKHAGADSWAIQTVTLDDTGLASSANGHGFVGAEIAVRTHGLDDASNAESYGGVGIRNAIHLTLNRSNILPGNTNPDDLTSFAHGIWVSGDSAATKTYVGSVYAVGMSMKTYSVFDARGAGAPFGYTDPVAAVRMSAGMVVDFNGGPSLNSNAGNYLKYDSASSKLLYYVAGVAKWSVDASGNMRCAGTVTGSVTP